MSNPAFDYLRQFKQVSEATEELSLKTIKKRYPNITIDELTNIFESGISGDYGKVYAIDPQTLIGWVSDYMTKRPTTSIYESPLLDNTIGITHKDYPRNNDEWMKEVNKSFYAFLRGVSTLNMHPHLYDRLMLDGYFEVEEFNKHMDKTNSIRISKQKCLEELFIAAKSKGSDKIYAI